jgi:methylmalonyl-CoA/ethylmalonyl-CoA epimerase
MQRIFGPVMQNAWVVDDLDAALDHWVNKMGVGPFYLFEHVRFQEIYFRGEPATTDMTAAIAYWGDIQIELIKQHNEAPSIYREFQARGLKGMQHMGVLTPDLDEHLTRLRPLGITPVQWGLMPTGMRFAYVSSDALPGTMIELIQPAPAITQYFGLMKQAADTWDGTNAIIRV